LHDLIADDRRTLVESGLDHAARDALFAPIHVVEFVEQTFESTKNLWFIHLVARELLAAGVDASA
jgi:hypothetical protein